MKFELFLTLENMHWYGYIPCPKDGDLSGVEVYQLEESDWPLPEANFLEPVDALCDALLDYGDIDFFDVDKCKKLSVWLEDQLAGNGATGRLRVLYEKLDEYARRAITLLSFDTVCAAYVPHSKRPHRNNAWPLVPRLASLRVCA